MHIVIDMTATIAAELEDQGWREIRQPRPKLRIRTFVSGSDVTVVVPPVTIKPGRHNLFPPMHEALEAYLRDLVKELRALRSGFRGRIRLLVHQGRGPEAIPVPEWFLQECAALGIEIAAIDGLRTPLN